MPSENRREYQRTYYATHKGKRRAIRRARREVTKERGAARKREKQLLRNRNAMRRRRKSKQHGETIRQQRRARRRINIVECRARDAIVNRSLNARFSRTAYAAKIRGISFTITLKQYTKLVIDAACTYCAGELPETGSGLDRKNSYRGYTVRNCVPCCRVCNLIRGKDNITFAEMLAVAKLLIDLRRRP